MKISQGKFETLDHTVYDGENMLVPLLVDRKHGLVDESNALLHIANIVGANLVHQETDISTMFEHIAQRLVDNERSSVIVEDPHGKASVNINQHTTSVSVREVGTWELPTALLFDWAQTWAELSE